MQRLLLLVSADKYITIGDYILSARSHERVARSPKLELHLESNCLFWYVILFIGGFTCNLNPLTMYTRFWSEITTGLIPSQNKHFPLDINNAIIVTTNHTFIGKTFCSFKYNFTSKTVKNSWICFIPCAPKSYVVFQSSVTGTDSNMIGIGITKIP